jgi:curli biogenesis system outer membrane secretion channel CsgG
MKFKMAMVIAAISTSAIAETTVSEKEYNLPQCSKPIASVMVGNISCKSAACQQTAADTSRGNALMAMAQMASGQSESTFPAIGDGLKAMLTTALKETGCFDIQEREAMDELAKELALVGKTVEVQQADFMISGAITSISMSTQKKVVGGGYIPIVGAFSTTKKTADLGIDIKIIDVNKAKVLDSKTFQGNNETSSYSLGGAGFGGVALVGGLSNIKGTPMEDIVRDVLARVASFSSMKLIETKGVTDVVMTNPIVKK